MPNYWCVNFESVGDFIDRGPKIRQVLETVRPMIEQCCLFPIGLCF